MTEEITHYTSYEGGEWKPFSYLVPPEELNQLLIDYPNIEERYGATVTWEVDIGDPANLFSVSFHSLRFQSGREWDIINGFRPPFARGDRP